MPTKSWMAERRQLTFWVTKDEAERFRTACEDEEKTQTQVLRETVQLLIASAEAKP